MPRPRFKNLPAEKREAIIEAAARDFAEHGYSGASMNRIIENAGFSKGAVYYYFDDKEDLFLTVILDAHDRAFDFMGDFPEVKTRDEFWAAMVDLFRKAMRFAMENPQVMGLQRCFAAALSRGELKRPLAEFQGPHFDFHRRFVRIGQGIGAVRTDIPEELLLSILQGIDESSDTWFARHFDELQTADRDRIITKMMMIYRRILEPGPDTEKDMLPAGAEATGPEMPQPLARPKLSRKAADRQPPLFGLEGKGE